jgi:hypothetical protein
LIKESRGNAKVPFKIFSLQNPFCLLDQIAQHRVQDAAVTIVVDFHAGIQGKVNSVVDRGTGEVVASVGKKMELAGH